MTLKELSRRRFIKSASGLLLVSAFVILVPKIRATRFFSAPTAGGAVLTFINDSPTAFNSTTSPKTTASQAVENGDLLIAYAINESESGAAPTIATATGSTSAWTTRVDGSTSATETEFVIWSATATATGNITVSFTDAGGTWYGGNVVAFRNSSGTGATAGPTSAAGAPSLAITTTVDNSWIFCVWGDWNAVDGASRTWRTVNSITPTSGNGLERTYFRDASHYTVYAAYWNGVGTAGVKTVGVSAPTGQLYRMGAVEIKP